VGNLVAHIDAMVVDNRPLGWIADQLNKIPISGRFEPLISRYLMKPVATWFCAQLSIPVIGYIAGATLQESGGSASIVEILAYTYQKLGLVRTAAAVRAVNP
jgi:hypothetical protein